MPRRRWLLRGETLIGSVGLAAAGILLLAITATGWWSHRHQQHAWRAVRSEQLRTLAGVLSAGAEALLAGDDLSPLRRLLVQARQQYGLDECRVVLADGSVLADSDPGRITLVHAPSRWPGGPIDEAIRSTQSNTAAGQSPNSMVIDQPLLVRGKGAALLHLSAAATPGTARAWELLAGIGAIGAVSLVAMLLLYRRARARLLTLSLIRESLLAAAAGTSDLSPEALSLRADLGPEAQAWNELLQQTEKLRRAGLADRVRESLGGASTISRTVPGQMPLSDPAAPPPAGAELESACDALAVGMIVVDANGSARHVNGAAAALLQLRRDQMLSKPIGELIGDQAVRDAVQGIIRGSGQRRTFELRREDDQGGGILRVHVRPLRRDDCGGALVTIEDITQQRVADAARNSFVAQATHELRTPLTNMRLCLEAALDDRQTDPAVLREHFNILSHETRRLERMVGEMLSMAEIEAGSLQLKSDDVRLEKVFDELQADYRPQAAEKRIELVFDLPPKLPVIVGDRDKLLVTLHNLVGNALKYTPAGGKVTVAVRVEGASAQMLVIDVIDTGIGISPEEQPKIFAKFYRARDPRVGKITGTGLGLALAREIARLHGGDITVQSELDKGSTFTLTLPARAAQAKAA